MSTPAVSVILPTHNRAHLLSPAIASVLNQTWRDLELIVVDDASADTTPSLVDGIADARLRYLRLDRNVGPAEARNRAIAQARGQWLAFQDSDDEWFPDKLEVQMAFALALGGDFGAVGSTLLRHTPNELERVRWPRGQAATDRGEVQAAAIYADATAYLQSLLVRRSAFLAVGGFDGALPQRSDIELCLRLAERWRFAAVDAPLAISFETPGSVSLKPDRRADCTRAIIARHAAVLARHPRALARWWYDVARCELLCGRRRGARSALAQALRADPRALRNWALLVLAPLPTPALATLARARLRARGRR